MAWLRIDDRLFLHPKWVTTPPSARGLWITALSYCGCQMSDGFVSARLLTMLGGTQEDAQALVESGLWEEAEGGYQIHDFLQYNLAREDQVARQENLSEARAQAGRAGGLRSGEVRRSGREESMGQGRTEASGKQNEATAKQIASNLKQNEAPGPEPVPGLVPRPGAISTPQTDRQTLVGDLHPARACEEPAAPVPVPPPSHAPLSVGPSVGRSRLSAGGEPPDKGAGAESLPASARESPPPIPDLEEAARAWCQEQLAGSPELAARVREAQEKAQKAGTAIRRPWQWQRGVIEQVQREQAERRARAAESPQAARDRAAEVRVIRAPKRPAPPLKPPERDPDAEPMCPASGRLPGAPPQSRPHAGADGLPPDPLSELPPSERFAWLQRQGRQIAQEKSVATLAREAVA